MPIQLDWGIKRRLARRNDPRAKEADEEFQSVKKQILVRDKFTCQGAHCGFTSVSGGNGNAGYLEVHHIDDDHHNNTPQNLITLCPFCHMVFTLGRRGPIFSGELVWLPGVTQGAINLICHVAFAMDHIAQNSDALEVELDATLQRYISQAGDLYSQLSSIGRSNIRNVERVLGDVSDVELLANVMASLPHDQYAKRHRVLHGLRLLPRPQHFSPEIEYWTRNVWLNTLPVTGWESVIHQTYDTFNQLSGQQ